jgi:23S rRNA (uracil747-C5)-methyltransferase
VDGLDARLRLALRESTVECHYYDLDRCRSCTLLPVPYADQLTRKLDRVRSLVDVPTWRPPVRSAEASFRNKAKMVVAGTLEQPTIGILAPDGTGVDLRECGLHEPGLAEALPVLADFIVLARLAPYSVSERRGELKHLLVTRSPDGDLMVRFVLRSTEARTRIEKHLPTLLEQLPVAVVSLNIQPDHKAVLEGEREILLHGSTLPMHVNELTLHLGPQSFFQTNTAVAARLYDVARGWVDELAPARVWDLYCGVGGFALHLAAPGRTVVGAELSEPAVVSARESAVGLPDVSFVVGDALTFARATAPQPDLVVVNPPRRGLGAELSTWLETSDVAHVLYSSCNAESLAKDLARMPSLRPTRGVLLDMFPQTEHYEVLVQLRR